MRKALIALSTLGLSAVLTLLLGEVAVRGWMRIQPSYDIEMWRYAEEAKRSVVDPRRAFAHRDLVDEEFYGVRIVTDFDGWRIDETLPPSDIEVPRVLLLGDSMTLGWGVAGHETFAARLPALLAPEHGSIEIVNTGVGGYNTTQEVATLRAVAESVSPSVVVLNWFVNDAEPLPAFERGTPWTHSRFLLFGWSRIDRIRRLRTEAQAWDTFYRDLYRPDQPGWVEAQQAFAEFGAICRERQIPCAVALIPELHAVGNAYPFTEIHELVASVARDAGLRVVDLTAQFGERDARELWVSWEDAHPNAEGHRILAEGIAELLNSMQWEEAPPP